jgi:hypothetical protein
MGLRPTSDSVPSSFSPCPIAPRAKEGRISGPEAEISLVAADHMSERRLAFFQAVWRLKQNLLTAKAAWPVDSAADWADATVSRCLSIELRNAKRSRHQQSTCWSRRFVVNFEWSAVIGRAGHVTYSAPGLDIGAVSNESASNLVADGLKRN